MICRAVAPDELELSLFDGFVRRQEVNLCYRREHGRWVVRSDPFVDDWSEADYRFLIECLHNTLKTGGALFGVFDGSVLKGFASVESKPMGSRGQYRDRTPRWRRSGSTARSAVQTPQSRIKRTPCASRSTVSSNTSYSRL